jgi:hypothetical protein
MGDNVHSKTKVVQHLEENLEIEEEQLRGMIPEEKRSHVTYLHLHLLNFHSYFFEKSNSPYSTK